MPHGLWKLPPELALGTPVWARLAHGISWLHAELGMLPCGRRLRGFRGRHGIWNILFCALIVASLLIMLATSAWGLAAGIRATRHLSDNFWSVVQVARTKVGFRALGTAADGSRACVY
jgi:hypothetical protein